MMARNDKPVMVCSACLRASCWYGMFLCDMARGAGTVVKTAGDLRGLNLEHECYWSDATFKRIYGTEKPDFAGSHDGDLGITEGEKP